MLTTEEAVRARLARWQGHESPKNLTPAEVQRIIEGVTATLLQRVGLTALPTDELRLASLRETCTELAVLKVRLHFFATDPQAVDALSRRWDQVLGSVPEFDASAVGSPRSNQSPTRVFTAWDETRVNL